MSSQYRPGDRVRALRAHGLINRVPPGATGTVFDVRVTTGNAVIDWDNDLTTEMPDTDLEAE